jgi:hypothetical protein
MRTMNGRRVAIAAAAAGLLAFGTATASADTVYNTLDGTIDATAEAMNLSVGGAAGSTTLQLQINGHSAGDHPGCNLNGAPHFIQLAVTSSAPAFATAAFGVGGSTFNTCSDVVSVVVTPVAVGVTTISFSIAASNLSNDPHLNFSLDQATFVVNVSDGIIIPIETTCDANPAAPAWAGALLKGNGLKPKPNGPNYVAAVAQHMTQGAAFDGFVKNADNLAYANAVWSYMKTTLGLTLPNGPSVVIKPGWECTTV